MFAVDRQSYEVRLTPRRGGHAISVTGNSVWSWQRQTDGRWLLARAIWNSTTALPESNSAADLAAIRALANRYTDRCNAGDLAGFMATLSDDIVFLPPDHEAVIGAAAVEQYVKNEFLDPFDVHLAFSFDALQSDGVHAFARGPFELALTPRAGGEQIVQRGKFLDVFTKQSDGGWKFASVMFNANAPRR
jgi:ketosteroid isomerase-like protein